LTVHIDRRWCDFCNIDDS